VFSTDRSSPRRTPSGALRSAYVQDDVRIGERLTLNLGLRWDLFMPYREDDDQQSNFDTSTGHFVVASNDAVMNGVRVGRYLQTYSKKISRLASDSPTTSPGPDERSCAAASGCSGIRL
jgi:outer membrane receptor for monomeric catechols